MKIGLCLKALLRAVVISLICTADIRAQSVVPGEWLVQLESGSKPLSLLEALKAHLNTTLDKLPQQPAVTNSLLGRISIKPISTNLNTWLISVPEQLEMPAEWVAAQKEVVLIQPNHYLTQRSNPTPNDPLFLNQWQYLNSGLNDGIPGADLDAMEAWSHTTGGLSAAGDTIVVAVIDGGVAYNHPDLSANLWKNWKEKPGDGLDNDDNGFVDDFLGWNVFSQSDLIQGFSTTHGTPVCGIVGAQGNNNIGVTGVNWNIKIMFVSGGVTISSILAAYDYVLQSRKKYNETNGAQGAFVVAVNSSWGIDFGMPFEAPLWCQVYDELGAAGILGVAATANMPVNVDEVGDLPTTCPSDYLISVSSLTNKDLIAPTAAWGQTNIDLASYGEQVFTLTSTDYGYQTGTSFAAPHVAGAVALLYAAPCPELIALSKFDPAGAALKAKSLILESAETIPALAGTTATGAKLNLGALIQTFENQCPTCPKPFAIQAQVSETNAVLTWISPQNAQQTNLRLRVAGDTTWNTILDVHTPFHLTGLQFCAPYEFALQVTCDGELSAWSPVVSMMTGGCCNTTNLLADVQATANSAMVVWSYLPNYSKFKLRYRQAGNSNWQIVETTDTTFTISNLIECSQYECILLGYCIDGWNVLSNSLGFYTAGCGACLDIPYCPVSVSQSTTEWIQAVQIGNWFHESGAGGNGFQDFTGSQPTELKFYPLSNQTIVLTPGFLGAEYKEYFKVYIDFNQDGDFFDDGELAFDPGFAQHGVVSGELSTPAFTQGGLTRMRVMMKYGENNQPAPTACESFTYGQIEDYCATLLTSGSPTSDNFESKTKLRIYPQPAQNWVWADLPGVQIEENAAIHLFDLSGKMVLEIKTLPLRKQAFYISTEDIPPGVYLITLQMDNQIFRGKLIKE